MPGRTLTRSKTIYSELKQEKLPFCDKKIKCETDQPVIKKKVIKNRKFINLLDYLDIRLNPT